jgi:hypothetical protein
MGADDPLRDRTGLVRVVHARLVGDHPGVVRQPLQEGVDEHVRGGSGGARDHTDGHLAAGRVLLDPVAHSFAVATVTARTLRATRPGRAVATSARRAAPETTVAYTSGVTAGAARPVMPTLKAVRTARAMALPSAVARSRTDRASDPGRRRRRGSAD